MNTRRRYFVSLLLLMLFPFNARAKENVPLKQLREAASQAPLPPLRPQAAFAAAEIFQDTLNKQSITAYGTILRCKDGRDAESGRIAYSLYRPAITVRDGILKLDLSYVFYKCAQLGDRVAWQPLKQTAFSDRLLAAVTRAFDVDIFLEKWPDKSYGHASIEIPLARLLSRPELARFNSGGTVMKNLELMNGAYRDGKDPDALSSYVLSAGYYIVEMELNGTEWRVLAFRESARF